MIVQLSSGQGPAECELGVLKLYSAIKKECPDLEIIQQHKSRFSEGFTSITFSTAHDLSHLEGSVLWICKSPYRPFHKRKNWYIDVSIIPEENNIEVDGNIRLERFHCGGKGGQNVNKVETGIRLRHLSTGITVSATEERNQHLNRKSAEKKLKEKLIKINEDKHAEHVNSMWNKHTNLQRGNPVKVFKGINFNPA